MEKADLKNKVAVITGAGRGIGRSIAFALAREGMRLVLTGINSGSLEKIKSEIKQDDILLVPADLNEISSCEVIIEKTVKEFGQLDVLINNAGLAVSKKLEDTTTADWEQLLNVNARAPFFLTKASLKYLKDSDAAHIINIGSVVDTKAYINQAAYTASKHALLGFSKVLAKEVHKDNIRVNVISPGGVNTEMVTKIRPDINTEELIAPEEIAELIVYLLKNRGNSMIDQFIIRRASKEPWV